MMKRENKRLHDMVEALLRLARLSSSKAEPRVVDIDALLKDVTSGLSRKMEDTKTSVVHMGDTVLWGDPALLNNLFQNLIENSIKYARSEEPPTIRVFVSRQGGFSTIRYEDNGRGIPPETREHIFEPFFQCSTEHAAMGLGLGLSVVQKIVAVHGGTISVTDKQTPGTCFIIKLPFSDRAGSNPERKTYESPPTEPGPAAAAQEAIDPGVIPGVSVG
jgi:hypothetical protein